MAIHPTESLATAERPRDYAGLLWIFVAGIFGFGIFCATAAVGLSDSSSQDPLAVAPGDLVNRAFNDINTAAALTAQAFSQYIPTDTPTPTLTSSPTQTFTSTSTPTPTATPTRVLPSPTSTRRPSRPVAPPQPTRTPIPVVPNTPTSRPPPPTNPPPPETPTEAPCFCTDTPEPPPPP